MQQATIINKYLPQIQQLMREHNVSSAYAFGSVVKQSMHESSDIDFLISFPANIDIETYADNYFSR